MRITNPVWEYRGETVKRLNGIDFIIKSRYSMEYDGKWDHSGFDVFLGLKKVAEFIGYPIEKDLARIDLTSPVIKT